jgi:hypothetical protein
LTAKDSTNCGRILSERRANRPEVPTESLLRPGAHGRAVVAVDQRAEAVSPIAQRRVIR